MCVCLLYCTVLYSRRFPSAAIAAKKKSANISKGRVTDIVFDGHVYRLVLLLRAKEVQVSNQSIFLLARKVLQLCKYSESPARTLRFSWGWLQKFKNRHNLVKRQSAKTHVSKASPSEIDEWQMSIKVKVISNTIPNELIGNKDETPIKLNASADNTLDVKGTSNVRYQDQGHLKTQFTTYCGGWAGAMQTVDELLNSRPATVTINDFTKDGHILPSMSIFKGKTAHALTNVLIEATCFDAGYSTYLTVRPSEYTVPPNGLRGVNPAWKKYIHFHSVPTEIQVWRKEQIRKNSASSKIVAMQYIPYVIHHKTGHVCTVTPSGWNTTETEHMQNKLVVLVELKRRRSKLGSNATGMLTSDNYCTHHGEPKTEDGVSVVKRELAEADMLTPPLKPKSTEDVQWCDTHLNALIKSLQKKLQSEQLYRAIMDDPNMDLELKNVPDDADAIRSMNVNVGEKIKIPQRADKHTTTLC